MTWSGLVVRALRHRRLSTVLSVLAVSLGVGLVVGIAVLRREARAHFEGAATTYDLVVGPKGSPLGIVLNAVFHLEDATGTLPESFYLRLKADPRVETALPYVVGDNYLGHRIVGTSPEVFGFEVRAGVRIAVAEGRPFAPFDPAREEWEAVVGAAASGDTGLRVGASFLATHGAKERKEGGEHEEAPWKVVGVLAPTGTPMDRVILIHTEAFYAMEGHDVTAGKASKDRQVSAVIVKLKPKMRALGPLLFAEIRATDVAQPAKPYEEIRRLFDIVGNADRLLLAVSVLVVVVAAVGILTSMTNTMNERRREIAMMRALGAPRPVVAGLIVGEASAIGAMGAVAGLAIGHAIVFFGAARLTAMSGVRVRGLAFVPEEGFVVAGAILLCALAGLVPALRAYRTDVATNLAPES